MVEYGCKREKKVKAMQSEIKKNIQGTNSEGKETGTQTNDLEQKEEKHTQPEQNEETRIQKMRRGLGNLWNNFKCFSIRTIGVPEREEEEQEIENLFEKIMKENVLNLANKTYRKPRESQRYWTQGSTHQGTL